MITAGKEFNGTDKGETEKLLTTIFGNEEHKEKPTSKAQKTSVGRNRTERKRDHEGSVRTFFKVEMKKQKTGVKGSLGICN